MTPRALLAALVLAAAPAWAGYSCRAIDDDPRDGRRWFQDEPCAPGYVHDPLPLPPRIREAPRIPEGAGEGSAGSEWQRTRDCRRCGYWVERGTAVWVAPPGRRGLVDRPHVAPRGRRR